MDLVEAILLRKSIRAFKPDPVPIEILEEILEAAIRAPSWANTQPWELIVVGGETLQELKEGLRNLASEKPRPDIPSLTEYPEPYGTRRRILGRKVLEMKGIDRKDKRARREWHAHMTTFFGAPHAIFLTVDRSFSQTGEVLNVWALFSCALLAMNIALLATHHGLGTCLEAAPVAYPDLIRERLEIPDGKLMVLAIAIGYPDWDIPVNQFRSERETVDRITRWYGFEQQGGSCGDDHCAGSDRRSQDP
jgi:nitroreductase